MLLMNVVLLIWYSNKNFGFRKIESYLPSKIDFEIWKCPIFASSASNCLIRYEQILSGCSLGCKNALNFTCLTMKFHNRVHTTTYVPHSNYIWSNKTSFRWIVLDVCRTPCCSDMYQMCEVKAYLGFLQ